VLCGAIDASSTAHQQQQQRIISSKRDTNSLPMMTSQMRNRHSSKNAPQKCFLSHFLGVQQLKGLIV